MSRVPIIRHVLSAAALTDVTAALIRDPTLVYDLLGAGSFGSHDRE